ncbi:MAG: PTS transporter subunit EIIC [Thomasclavelia sp.]|nr:PTS transporter subunit EIIC [Thomasclavelia sp.]
MEKLTNVLNKFLMPISTWVSRNKSLQGIAKGFMRILPVTIISSLFYLIANFPIDAWTNWLTKSGISSFILIPYNVTMGLFALYAVFSIAYSYAENEKSDAISVGIIALICFFVLTPYAADLKGALFAPGDLAYSFGWLGCKGLFVAMFTAIIVAKVYILFQKKGWTIKMPDGVPPYVERSFASLIPGFILAAVFAVIAYCFSLTSFGNIHELIYHYLQTPLTSLGGSLWGYLIATMIIQLLWWFGIHGFNVVAAVMMPIWLGIDMARLAGETTNPFGMSMMTVVGQSTVSVVIVLLFFCKSKQLKTIGKIAAPAALFNIGEPIVFGVPNVLNPYMFIPTVILVPLVTNLFFYFGFASGIVTPLSGAQVSMQVPVVLYGLIQGNWMVALWQALAIPLAVVLFLPFYKMYDKTLVEKEEAEAKAKAEIKSDDVVVNE